MKYNAVNDGPLCCRKEKLQGQLSSKYLPEEVISKIFQLSRDYYCRGGDYSE